MITRDEVLMGRDKDVPLSTKQEQNLALLLTCLNNFRAVYGRPMIVSSGYRTPAINAATKGAAKRSNHIQCLACDFKDPDGALDAWCLANLTVLSNCGLYLEDPAATPGWCHLQAAAPASGRRVFIP